MNAFGWRRLTERAQVHHALDEQGRLVLLGTPDAPPFTTAVVRDGTGGFDERSLESLGFVWEHRRGEAWALRTKGPPQTMMALHVRWRALVDEHARPYGLDPRLVLVTIACEAGNARPDADGLVRAPRTERGYPRRAGEGDRGDYLRDAEDWASSGGAHSSHGLMQTLIATAHAARRDLFAGIDPAHYRDVLARPAASIAAGVAHMAHFGAGTLADPLAFRVKYGSGSVRPSDKWRWGAVLYDELVPLFFAAYWNDYAEVLTGAWGHIAELAMPRKPVPTRAIVAGTIVASVVTVAAGIAALLAVSEAPKEGASS